MSAKILKTLDDVLEKEKTSDEVAEFIRFIVAFECFENSYRYKATYREKLDVAIGDGEK